MSYDLIGERGGLADVFVGCLHARLASSAQIFTRITGSHDGVVVVGVHCLQPYIEVVSNIGSMQQQSHTINVAPTINITSHMRSSITNVYPSFEFQ